MKNACERVVKNIPPAPGNYKVVFDEGLPASNNATFTNSKLVLETL